MFFHNKEVAISIWPLTEIRMLLYEKICQIFELVSTNKYQRILLREHEVSHINIKKSEKYAILDLIVSQHGFSAALKHIRKYSARHFTGSIGQQSDRSVRDTYQKTSAKD